jgi:preprotein translocase subunit SecD
MRRQHVGLLWSVAPAAVIGALAMVQLGHIHGADAQSSAQSEAASARRGCLSFHLVHPEVLAYGAMRDGAPAGFRITLIRGSERPEEGLVVSETPVVTGSDLADAEAAVDANTQQPAILLRFDAAGARKLAAFTQENLGRALAIVLDGRVVSAPLIREPILGGHAQISGTLTRTEADELAGRLRARDCRGE